MAYFLNSTPAVRVKSAAEIAASTKPAANISDYRLPGSNERVVASNGEVNAYTRRDLLNRNIALAASVANGDVISDADAGAQARMRQRAASQMELLHASATDPRAQRQLGESMANEIYMTSTRKGVARRFLNKIPLNKGELPRFPVRSKNAIAGYITGDNRVETQILTDKWLNPPEGSIQARIFVSQTEINQSNTNVLDEKVVEGMEAIMVSEDRYWRRLVQEVTGIENDQSVVAGSLSPQALMAVRQRVLRWGIPAAYCYMASDLFQDIVGDSSFVSALDPVARHELVMTGEIAQLFGMTLISESYRHPEHQVLNEGEFIIVSDPAYHGAYSDRGGVDSKPIDVTTDNVMGSGWWLGESFTAAIGNARSVAVGRRI